MWLAVVARSRPSIAPSILVMTASPQSALYVNTKTANSLAEIRAASIHHATPPPSSNTIHSKAAAAAIRNLIFVFGTRHGHKSNCALRRGDLSHIVQRQDVC